MQCSERTLSLMRDVLYALQEDESTGVQVCVQWLQAHGAVVTTPTAGEIPTEVHDSQSSVQL